MGSVTRSCGSGKYTTSAACLLSHSRKIVFSSVAIISIIKVPTHLSLPTNVLKLELAATISPVMYLNSSIKALVLMTLLRSHSEDNPAEEVAHSEAVCIRCCCDSCSRRGGSPPPSEATSINSAVRTAVSRSRSPTSLIPTTKLRSKPSLRNCAMKNSHRTRIERESTNLITTGSLGQAGSARCVASISASSGGMRPRTSNPSSCALVEVPSKLPSRCAGFMMTH
mmetsp:Transcript_36904/g.97250  ORF Transcript_36904/g.97250 Transcript_36904/m.97250 type:complete len:225 (-) Transcript_36904:202-876(-)